MVEVYLSLLLPAETEIPLINLKALGIKIFCTNNFFIFKG